MPSRQARIAVAIGVGVVAAAYVAQLAHVMPHYGTDFDPVRAGARLVIHGQDPYSLIGPGRPVVWNYRLRYPMTAVVLGIPFVWLNVVVARVAFVGLGSGVLAYAVTRHAYWPLLVFASASWWSAIGLAQWSPAMLAACLVPSLGFVIAAKPNVGLAVLCAARDRTSAARMLVGAGLLLALSFALLPKWLGEWLSIAHDTPDVRPLVLSSIGPVMLLAILRWRRPEARLLAAMACVPMNPGLYEGVMLFLIPQSAREALVLATTSWFIEPLVNLQVKPGAWYADISLASGRAMLVCMFVPALVMVLLRSNRLRGGEGYEQERCEQRAWAKYVWRLATIRPKPAPTDSGHQRRRTAHGG